MQINQTASPCLSPILRVDQLQHNQPPPWRLNLTHPKAGGRCRCTPIYLIPPPSPPPGPSLAHRSSSSRVPKPTRNPTSPLQRSSSSMLVLVNFFDDYSEAFVAHFLSTGQLLFDFSPQRGHSSPTRNPNPNPRFPRRRLSRAPKAQPRQRGR